MSKNQKRIEEIRDELGGTFQVIEPGVVIKLGNEMKDLEAHNSALGVALLAIDSKTAKPYEGNPAAEGIAAAKADAAKIAEASGVPCPDFLTEKEFEVLTAVYEVAGNGYDINNINDIQELFDDNYSWFDPADVTAALPEMKQEAVAALLGSLEKKGLLSNKYDRANGVGPWLGIIDESTHVSLVNNIKENA